MRNSKSFLELIHQRRTVFGVRAVDVLALEARTPLAIPARVAVSFTEARLLPHESLSWTATRALGVGVNILRCHVFVVVLVRTSCPRHLAEKHGQRGDSGSTSRDVLPSRDAYDATLAAYARATDVVTRHQRTGLPPACAYTIYPYALQLTTS